jgi:hypothetical protein
VTPSAAASAAIGSADWVFINEEGLPLSVPEGGDRKFTVGMLKGRTFLEITLQDKLQYFSIRGAKELSTEQRECGYG